jgi:NAD(P)-dependent dehydrogenase (short-subunit alcohol dehydrogenase family)
MANLIIPFPEGTRTVVLRGKCITIGRMGAPDEIAGLAAYLCSDEASFITGAAYDIDGGVTSLR